MPKVILKGFIVVPEEDLDVVEKELENHRRLTLQEPGCITFEVTKRKSNPFCFDVYEEFKDRSSFDLHQERVKASYWGKVTVNVERHYEIFE